MGGRENEPLHFFNTLSAFAWTAVWAEITESIPLRRDSTVRIVFCGPGQVKRFFGPVNKAVKSWWWKIIKAALLHFFPPPSLVCVETCIYTAPNEHLQQNGIRYEPRKTCCQTLGGDFWIAQFHAQNQCDGWTWKWFSVVWWVNSGAAASKAPGAIYLITLLQPKVKYFSCRRCNIVNYIVTMTCKVLRWVSFTSLLYLHSCWLHFPF